MDGKRFDDLARRMGSRFSRRTLLKGTGGIVAGAVSARALSVSAQDPSTTVTDRFISVRQYAYSGSIDDARQGLGGLIEIMEKNPAFISYDLVDAGPNGILAISTFLDQTSAVDAANKEDEWISDNASDILSSQPTILSGDVFLRSDLDTGCSCITGTEDPCNAHDLICCQTASRPGAQGVCMTSETTCPAPDAPTATATVSEPTVAPDDPTATSVPTEAPTEGPTATSAPASPTACVGEGCDCTGGVEGNCADDLICCQAAPGIPGGSGTCEQSDNCNPEPCQEEGCICSTGTESPCDDGMVCCTGAMPGTPTAPGAPGICRTESQCGCTSEDCHCNGGVQGNCDEGLTCCQGEPSRPGGPGVCKESCS